MCASLVLRIWYHLCKHLCKGFECSRNIFKSRKFQFTLWLVVSNMCWTWKWSCLSSKEKTAEFWVLSFYLQRSRLLFLNKLTRDMWLFKKTKTKQQQHDFNRSPFRVAKCIFTIVTDVTAHNFQQVRVRYVFQMLQNAFHSTMIDDRW